MNQINVISPYRWEDMWVFDDPSRELDKEAFVCGTGAILDFLTQDIADATNGFNLIFSKDLFPGVQHRFRRVGQELGGWWYEHPEYLFAGWLCPALYKYFSEAPEVLYVKVQPRSEVQ